MLTNNGVTTKNIEVEVKGFVYKKALPPRMIWDAEMKNPYEVEKSGGRKIVRKNNYSKSLGKSFVTENRAVELWMKFECNGKQGSINIYDQTFGKNNMKISSKRLEVIKKNNPKKTEIRKNKGEWELEPIAAIKLLRFWGFIK